MVESSPSQSTDPTKSAGRTRVLLGDSSQLVLVGIQAFLADGIDVVGATRSYAELLPLVRASRADVALVEFDLLYETSVGAYGALRELARKLPVIVTAQQMFPADVLRTFRAQAAGVVIKDERPQKLIEAIAAACSEGQRYIDPRLARDILDLTRKGQRDPGPFGLTVQEQRVVGLLGEGRTNAEIARSLGISVETVRTHLRSVLPKLGAYDRVHAARIAVALDLDGPPAREFHRD